MTKSPRTQTEREALHAAIMNVPGIPERHDAAFVLGYKQGHRDARHAAAELAIASPVNAAPPLGPRPIFEPEGSDAQFTLSLMGNHVPESTRTRIEAALQREFAPVNAAPAGEPTDEQINAIDLRPLSNYETGGGWLRAYARAVLALRTAPAASLRDAEDAARYRWLLGNHWALNDENAEAAIDAAIDSQRLWAREGKQ